jgi:hypothetical protein
VLTLDRNSEVIFGYATGLHENKAVQYKIWAPTEHMLWDCGKLQKTLIDLTSSCILTVSYQPGLQIREM